MAGASSSISLTALLAAGLGTLADAAGPAANAGSDTAPGTALFDDGQVRRIRIEIPSASLETLRLEPRTYVRALVREDDKAYPETGVHLKGRTGSFRSLDDKPALTLSFDRFSADQRFHGYRKVHLNNSVEDPSYLHEWLGTELFLAGGVPAPRVGHALLELNGRKLGLYVLKEGFAQEFLSRHFRRTEGNLYENDPDRAEAGRLRRDSGAGPDDGTDLRQLAAAVREPDLAKRWERLPQLLDMDRFLSFMAIEVMAGHRDGYCLAQNNFRLYHDPATEQFVFLPHGMDHLFERADLPLQPRMAGPVARAVMDTPAGRRGYRERVALLLTNVFNVGKLTRRADLLLAQIRPALDRPAARQFESAVAVLKEQVSGRAAYLAQAVNEPPRQPVRFQAGVAPLSQWLPADEPAGGKLERATSPDAKAALRIQAGPVTAASWRSEALLEAGHYRFEAMARTRRVAPLTFGKHHGAGLRVAGSPATTCRRLTGDQPWQKLEVELEIRAAVESVTLICELRASAGEAWFDLESLRLVRLP